MRLEVLRIEKEILGIFIFSFTGALIAAGVYSKATISQPELIPFLYQIVIIVGLSRYTALSRRYWRIVTFIQVNSDALISLNVSYLKWEFFNSLFGDSINKYLRRWTHLFTLLTFIGLYISGDYIVDIIGGLPIQEEYIFQWKNIQIVPLLLLHVVGIWYVWKGVFKFPQRDKYLERWRRINSR